MPLILNDFLNYLSGILGYSENTIKGYSKDLMQFFKFIKEYMEISVDVKKFNIFILSQVKEHHIIAFLVYLNFSRNNIASTRQRKLSSIRRFYKWLFSTFPYGYNRENPAKYIYNIERTERLPKYLTLSQAKKIQKIFTIDNSIYYIRNNAIISTFLSTGARASELISINIADINFNDGKVLINRGKGKKERVVYLNKTAKGSIEKYLKFRNKDKKIINICEPLFLNKYGKRIGIDGVEEICKRAYSLMELQHYGYTTHTLRHTAATLMYQYTKDILIVKKFLGHAYISTTEIYSHLENSEARKAVDENPLNSYIVGTLEKVA